MAAGTLPALVLAALVAAMVLGIEADWLDLLPTRTKCVSEEIQPNVVVLADYALMCESHPHLAPQCRRQGELEVRATRTGQPRRQFPAVGLGSSTDLVCRTDRCCHHHHPAAGMTGGHYQYGSGHACTTFTASPTRTTTTVTRFMQQQQETRREVMPKLKSSKAKCQRQWLEHDHLPCDCN